MANEEIWRIVMTLALTFGFFFLVLLDFLYFNNDYFLFRCSVHLIQFSVQCFYGFFKDRLAPQHEELLHFNVELYNLYVNLT